MITEISVIDSINVTEVGCIEVRRADKVLRDGQEIAKTYHRHVLTPGTDLTGQDERVVAVAIAVWTPEVVAAYQAPEADPAVDGMAGQI